MEENKNEMVNESEVQSKPTYEDLEKSYNNLVQYAQNLENTVRKMDMQNIFKRLDYLLKVVELGVKSEFSVDFIVNCVNEIEGLLTLPKNEPAAEEPKEEVKEAE